MEIHDHQPLLDNIDNVDNADEQKSDIADDRTTNNSAKDLKPRTVNVEPVLILYFLAFVPSRILMEQFLYTLISEEHNVTSIVRLEPNETHCTVNKSDPHFMEHEIIQDEASTWTLYLKFTFCIPAIFAVIVVGAISDRVSRKLPITLSLITSILQMFMCVSMVLFKLPKPFLFLATLIDGMSGSIATLLMGCFAYTGNATSHDNRTLRIAINELCIGLAVSSADVGIGYMIKRLGFLYPFILILGVQFLNLFYVVIVLQETHVATNSKQAFSCKHTLECFAIYGRRRPGNKRWKLWIIQCVFWCYAIGSIGRSSVSTLYLQNVPFCWNAKLLGYYIAVSSLVYSLGNMIPVAMFKNKNSDIPLLIASLISAFSSMILFAVSVTPFMLYIVIFVAVFHQLGYTILRALISKQVTVHEQGAIFSSVAFLELSSDLLGSIAFNSIYSATLLMFRGFVFFVVAGVFGIGTILSVILYWKTRNEISYEQVNKTESDVLQLEETSSLQEVDLLPVTATK